ncbi:helix-turn-helix domain-containing protein [Treponema brennaborense]|uniref:Helix-turn-helix domain protein n=1 Tax=Treponema brennaborense (strain DSM 12168 / CIP 105900 / DD5/3) TaxID=906968 RepID=F4LJT5_TREBD|nr:helix-turn-helix domain protein [Treponema brennaborense DSM 12168]
MLHTFFMCEINIRKIFGENVKYYRKQMGLSQEQLSEILEISPNHLSVIETGGKFVTYKLLEKMIDVFNIAPSLLFYSQNAHTIDGSVQNKINSIIDKELENAQSSIHEKIEELYRKQ